MKRRAAKPDRWECETCPESFDSLKELNAHQGRSEWNPETEQYEWVKTPCSKPFPWHAQNEKRELRERLERDVVAAALNRYEIKQKAKKTVPADRTLAQACKSLLALLDLGRP